MSISEPLARVLAAGRSQFNARVLEAKHRYPTLDTTAFLAFLRGPLDAVVQAAASVAPERVTAVVVAGYDMGLELVAQALAGPGARHQLLDRVWLELAPRHPKLLAEQPFELLGALSNAAVSFARLPDAAGQLWLQELLKLSERVESLSQLRALGQIVAWRAGFAQFRQGALEVADHLPEALVLAAVDAPSDASWPALRARFEADPWYALQAAYGPGAREIGQFSGFGGLFPLPPKVRASGEGFCVRSGEHYWFLLADAFGSMLFPASSQEFPPQQRRAANTPFLQGNTLSIGSRQIALDLPDDGLALAWNEHTVAVSSPYSFAIRLFPRA